MKFFSSQSLSYLSLSSLPLSSPPLPRWSQITNVLCGTLLAALMLGIVGARSHACDVCSFSGTAVDNLRVVGGTVRFSLEHSFTDQSHLELNGRSMPNDDHESIRAHTTTIFGAYDISPSFSLQAVIPYIRRSITRHTDAGSNSFIKEGMGDLALTARFVAYQWTGQQERFQLSVFGGIKLPTGDSDALGDHDHHAHTDEEHGMSGSADHSMEGSHEEHESDHDHESGDHEGGDHESAIHAHDLALGTGSVDTPVGISAIYERGRFFLTSDLNYTVRSQGHYSYEFGNDLMWTVAPGYSVISNTETTAAARLLVIGEHRESDRLGGELHPETNQSVLFMGPQVLLTYQRNYSFFSGVDFPIYRDSNGLALFPEYRIRTGLTARF